VPVKLFRSSRGTDDEAGEDLCLFSGTDDSSHWRRIKARGAGVGELVTLNERLDEPVGRVPEEEPVCDRRGFSDRKRLFRLSTVKPYRAPWPDRCRSSQIMWVTSRFICCRWAFAHKELISRCAWDAAPDDMAITGLSA